MFNKIDEIKNETSQKVNKEILNGNIENIRFKEAITQRFIDLETGEEIYNLAYQRKGLLKIENIKVTPEMIQESNIRKLANKGLNVTDNNRRYLAEQLADSLEKSQIVFVTNEYGFRRIDDELCFIGNECISNKTFEETYVQKEEKIDIRPLGRIENWLEVYNTEVKGNYYLETSVVLGLSAPILHLLNDRYPDLKSLMIHIAGDSTTGKSTASMLAVSVAGNPNTTSTKSLFRRWNATNNAILASLNGIKSFPIVYDELSTNSNAILTDLIYSLTEGVGKSRANRYGEVESHGLWNTVIISNGESSIFNRLNDNTGLKARVFEFFNKTWTTSAEQSEKIKEVVSRNYGHILNKFVEYILSIGQDEVEKTFEVEQLILKKLFPNSRLKDRIAKKLAVITTTAKLINSSSILNVNYEEIIKLLCTQEEEAHEEREVSEIARDKLFQYLSANVYLFNQKSNHRVIGRLDSEGVFLIREELYSILNQLRFEDPKAIVLTWVKKGYTIQKETDRQISRVIIENDRKVGYFLKIPTEYDSLIYGKELEE